MTCFSFKERLKIAVKINSVIDPIVNETNDAKAGEWVWLAKALLIVVWIGGKKPKINPKRSQNSKYFWSVSNKLFLLNWFIVMIPTINSSTPIALIKLKSWTVAPNNPNVSIMTPIIIWPATVAITVNVAPNFGNNNKLPVK